MFKKTECSCASCQRACQKTPGWFRPGEAERAAKHLGLSLPVFFRRYLGVQWWEAATPVFVLAPAITSMSPGEEYPGSPIGTCVFFKGGRCEIHAVKPYDCSHGNPCEMSSPEHARELRRARRITVARWRAQQAQIRSLLGRKPKTSPFSYLDHLFSSML